MFNLMQILGGLGLFLLGMIIMTDALHAMAGKVVREAIMRFTRTPVSGAMTGAVATTVLQSSSATTVAAVGFVGAGLMSFPESLGIIFGANIGTTIKGWIVALFGFKFNLDVFLLPVLFIGVLMKLFGKGNTAHLGMTLAGFSIIFVGIATLQEGMSGLSDLIASYIFSADTWMGRLKLVALGILITLLTQSSSAGVAAALTAIHVGTINFEQAASLVIGMDVGTTVTAAMATIGGSAGSRRTGFSHVIYNVFTGIGALLLLTPYALLWEFVAPGQLESNAEIALVGFHTSFNFIGVIAILPFTYTYARFIQRIIPDKADIYTQSLDRKLLSEPDMALTAVQSSIRMEIFALISHLSYLLGNEKSRKIDLSELQASLDETHAYVDLIHLDKQDVNKWNILLSTIHSLDHMQRLHERCDEDTDRARAARHTPDLAQYVNGFRSCLEQIKAHIAGNNWQDVERLAEESAISLTKNTDNLRDLIVGKVGLGELSVPDGTDCLEAIRWLYRVNEHVIKIMHHQSNVQHLINSH